MSLKIIGSGFGRTGTMSTKQALEQLGLGPCHHMAEVFNNPDQPKFWSALAAGADVDWTEVFVGYRAQVDFPGAAYWQDIVAAFPEARVLHTERPEDVWWASYSGTICKLFAVRERLDLPPHVAAILADMDEIVFKRVFGGLDRDTSIAAYRRNNQLVRELVPADRLLIFAPSDGWSPLCKFFGVPVPDEPFPRTNARDEFWERLGGEPANA